MGQKVNYSKNKSKIKIIRIIAIVLIAMLVIYIFFRSLKNVISSINNDNENSQNQSQLIGSTSQFGSLEELLQKYNCSLKSQKKESGILIIEADLCCNLYTGEISNENFFLSLCKEIAEFNSFEQFELLDNAKDIKIDVICENSSIVEFIINDDINYYLNNTSRLSRDKSYKITNFTIQSLELQQLIDNNWDENKVNFGTKECNFDGYSIYFDEGIKCKTVARSIFNIVFTEKYKGKVAGGLTTSATPSSVISALGEPTFNHSDYCYGYIGDSNYLFFDFVNHQISVYPIIEITKEDENYLKELIEKMNENLDIKDFVVKLTEKWADYDLYEYDSNYVDLKYTLKGIELNMSSESLKNGIFIYQNYFGNRDICDLENVYIKDTDAINNMEYNRFIEESQKSYGAVIQQNENSDNYYVELIKDEDYGIIKVRFIAKNSDFPDVELNENLYTYVWMSQTEILYSIKNQGIYYFDFSTCQKQKIIEGKNDFHINSYENDILSYDNEITKIQK